MSQGCNGALRRGDKLKTLHLMPGPALQSGTPQVCSTTPLLPVQLQQLMPKQNTHTKNNKTDKLLPTQSLPSPYAEKLKSVRPCTDRHCLCCYCWRAEKDKNCFCIWCTTLIDEDTRPTAFSRKMKPLEDPPTPQHITDVLPLRGKGVFG